MTFTIIRYTDEETMNEYLVELLQAGAIPEIEGSKMTFTGTAKIVFNLKKLTMTVFFTPIIN